MKNKFHQFYIATFLVLSFIVPSSLYGQDTLSISLNDFIERGLERSGQVSYLSDAVDLASNRVDQARGQRILPSINLSTQHGVIPGVFSGVDSLSPNEFYLDPNLSNDWEDWAVFTRAELNAVQPIYTWGAINSAIEAAESVAEAAKFRFDSELSEIEVQLFELYYSYQLALEMERILADAESQMSQVENQLEKMQEEGDPDLEQADVFKFEIFKAEFQVQKVEVQQGLENIRRIWQYALDSSETVVYQPEEMFLEAIPFTLEPYSYYEEIALNERPELKGADAGLRAAENQIDALQAQYYPALFLGLSGSYANTPNRPRQSNPFIINSTNYASGAVGLSIRQNLNFLSNRKNVERARIEHRRVNHLKDALLDGIVLELNETYREAAIAQKRVEQLEEVLTISKNWVRQEQLDYDFGFGDVNNLLDSVQKELETRVELKQKTFEMNRKVAELYKTSGISIRQLSIN